MIFSPNRTLMLLAAAGLTACGGNLQLTPSAAGATATLALLETSDLHANVLSYDYFKLAADPSYGFERTATLIRQARSEFPNTVLLDNGDTLQGTALADNEATVHPLACGDTPSIHKAMKALKFDAGTLGNHEFNYGLPFLDQILGNTLDTEGLTRRCATAGPGPGFEVVLGNVFSSKTQKPLVQPYTLLQRTVSATVDGKTVQLPLKIGVLGLTTPGILNWDKRHLEGKVTTAGAVETARDLIPKMRAEGADIVVALLHGGLDSRAYSPTMENPAMDVAKVPGLDALFLGHQHLQFPKPEKPDFTMDGADNAKGTLHGVPAVMPQSWGKALGVIALNLRWTGQKWEINKDATRVQVRTTLTGKDSAGKNTYVAIDPAIAPLVQARHEDTLNYVKAPIGQTDYAMSTRLADVGDVGAIQLVNQAQQAYVSAYIQASLPQYASLPVLSVSAPFKSGFQGPDDYTRIAAGPLAINNAADLYLYPNTVYAVKVTGAQIKAWLEATARRFNRIDPASSADQWLVSTYPGYNFDVFTTPDVQYDIDVSQAEGSRIKNLRYKGADMAPGAEFIIATNNYRATTKMIPQLDGSSTLWESPDTNRDVLINYVRQIKSVTRATNGSARSWRFTPVATAGRVLFKSAPGAESMAADAGLSGISATTEPLDAKGLATLAISLKDSR